MKEEFQQWDSLSDEALTEFEKDLTTGESIMKAYEIQATVKEEGRLELPVHLAKRLPLGQTFRVIILVPESDEMEEQEWAQITAQEFAKGYSEEDSIYDRM